MQRVRGAVEREGQVIDEWWYAEAMERERVDSWYQEGPDLAPIENIEADDDCLACVDGWIRCGGCEVSAHVHDHKCPCW